MSDDKISEVDLGRLIQAVETLTIEVSALNSRVRELETQLAKGKGVLSGVVLVSGACGALVAAVLNKWL
jgi:hypothetical protein|tara:strand:+ start:1047 stop:1253 length:207 start_codon:yes stop_codon:yes gene_type:complete